MTEEFRIIKFIEQTGTARTSGLTAKLIKKSLTPN